MRARERCSFSSSPASRPGGTGPSGWATPHLDTRRLETDLASIEWLGPELAILATRRSSPSSATPYYLSASAKAALRSAGFLSSG